MNRMDKPLSELECVLTLVFIFVFVLALPWLIGHAISTDGGELDRRAELSAAVIEARAR